jgi:hypothetical protein
MKPGDTVKYNYTVLQQTRNGFDRREKEGTGKVVWVDGLGVGVETDQGIRVFEKGDVKKI